MKRAIVIIGGGPAGLAAAISAYQNGERDILILERENYLGGILNQCIHNGFGLHTFKEELTGPEYAARYVDQIHTLGIEYKLNTMVLDIDASRKIIALNETDGIMEIVSGAIILAMGCRERPRGALNVPGYRPSGIFSAGTAQKFVNIDGYLPGREIVILGSGDIGLIMARRLTLEGAKVKMVLEIMPYSGGLKRNIVQCLDDYDIPLKLSHTVTKIHGKDRVEGITYAMVDEHLNPIKETEQEASCDTLLLSVGLIPENELSRKAGVAINPKTQGPLVSSRFETSVPGIFACGNVLHVHDLVDYVSEEAAFAGKYAQAFVQGQRVDGTQIPIVSGKGCRYSVPTTLFLSHPDKTIVIRFRVDKVYENTYVSLYFDEERLSHKQKRVLTPGEMEQIIIPTSWLKERPNTKRIMIAVEEDEK